MNKRFSENQRLDVRRSETSGHT